MCNIACSLITFEELVKSEIEHEEHCEILCLTLRKTENVGTNVYLLQKFFLDTDRYEELGMDTDSLDLALSEENLEDVILPKKRAEGKQLQSKDCGDNFTANATDNLFPRTCCNAQKKLDKKELGLFKEEFRCAEMLLV